VLNGVSFAAHRGEVLALLGPNGAGKTTTIEILEGFRMRSAGEVSVLGADPAHGGEAWRARTGVVLQSWRDHAKWQVRELLAHLGRYYAPYSTASVTRPWDTDDLLETVGLTAHARKRVRSLSGGQRRRLDVAIGIVGRPELLFLDEPTTGLDPRGRNQVWDTVRGVAQDGATVLLTTQYLDEADELADRIVVIDHGQVVAEGTPAELKARTGGRALEVRAADRLLTSQVAAMVQAVTGLSPEVRQDTGLVTASGADPAMLAEVIRRLDDDGIEATEVGLRLPSLDEVFLTLTGHQAGDEPGIADSTGASAPDAGRAA
jgi:ABC-2 type transport system ATP-binding protein